MSDAAEETAEVAPKKTRRWLKLVFLLAVVLLLAGGGGAGYFWWKGTQAAEEGNPAGGEGQPAAEGGHAEEGESGLLPFEPFVVNLADADASRFLRVNLRLVIDKGEAVVKEIEEDKVVMTRLRSGILELLSTKTSSDLVSAEGKDALKKQIEHLANEVLSEAKVRDVLFVEFVVQF